MRLLVFFDLPQTEKIDTKIYRQFIKFLDEQGFIRVQYSMYVKLCINAHVANSNSNKVRRNCPIKGDVRYTILSEKQYVSIKNINCNLSFQENITNSNRILIIQGRDFEDSR
ncbi:MAG: CRISPR-associated endonuclease Cas2 [Mycoplasmatales bacterium]